MYSTISAFLTLGVLSLVVIVLAFLMILPKEYGRVKWRRISLLIVSGIIVLFSWAISNTEKLKLLKVYYESNFPILKDYISSIEFIIVMILLVLAIVIILLHFLIQDNSAMKEHKSSFDIEFPEKEFKERITSFCSFLKNQIQQLDMDTNWSDAHFVPLDAEVVVFSDNKKRRKITDLLSAIKKDKKSKTFLVLGDPGSGKSVALRTLSKQLLKETSITYKIPIYINLKEWQIDVKWTESSPPSYESLYDFVIWYLKGKDKFADDFIDEYFKRLFENGHIFFIFDSFDEIPAVLDESETSWLIDKLSEVLDYFLAGANDSRGILASRLSRRPSKRFQSTTVLEIRPFSEFKIRQALQKYILFNKNLVNSIFMDRPELIPIASNPFSVALIYNYIKENKNSLPRNQAELYSSYINKRLDSCSEKITKKKLTKDKVLKYTVDIAYYIFENKNLGLEANSEELQNEFINEPIAEVIDVLKYARIGRIGNGSENRFSFVHRRFTEYFVVKRLLDNPFLINIDSNPLNSRYRDALVLYCEVSSFEEAKKIALYCWEILKFENQYEIKQVHALRFLRDAFKRRKECLLDFEDELGEYINAQLNSNSEMLHGKLAAESIGLLSDNNINLTLTKAMNLDNYWINETAFYSNRHLSKLTNEMEQSFYKYFNDLPISKLLKSFSDIEFSLSLSEPFSNCKKLINYRRTDYYIFAITLIIALIVFPIPMIFTNIVFFVLHFTIKEFHEFRFDKVYNFYRRIVPITFLIFFIFFYNYKIEILSFFIKYSELKDYFLLLIITISGFFHFLFYKIKREMILASILNGIRISFRDFKTFALSIRINFIGGGAAVATGGVMGWVWIGCVSVAFMYGMARLLIDIEPNTFLDIFSSVVTIFSILVGLIVIGFPFISIQTQLDRFEIFKLSRLFRIFRIFLIPIVIILDFINYEKEKGTLKYIDYEDLNTRENIYNIYKSLQNNKAKLIFVSNLEINVQNVEVGLWPAKDILKMSSNEADIRLIQLEERWLGISK
ncbi:MAG: NACHT domain-containing protein [Mariniphaga sp.]